MRKRVGGTGKSRYGVGEDKIWGGGGQVIDVIGVISKDMRITREQALKAYNNSKKNENLIKIVFELYYPTFEDYWRECEKLNNLPQEEYQKKVEEAKKG